MRALAIIAVIAVGPRAEARGCSERSDVVGFHHCSRFGDKWSRESHAPHVWIDLGYFYHRFTAEPFQLGGAPLVLGGGAGNFDTSAEGFQMRVLGGIGPVFYTGLEIDGGGNDIMPEPIGIQPSSSFYVGPMWVAGAHIIERYRIALSAELAGGVRYDDFFTCTGGKSSCSGPDSSQTARELEARVRADVFFHPHFSLGIAFGKSLIADRDRMWMISFGIHGRTMDGMY